jgi:hypothetical protein
LEKQNRLFRLHRFNVSMPPIKSRAASGLSTANRYESVMKCCVSSLNWMAGSFAIVGWLAQAEAATLTIAPPVTSNTYAGVITLNIGGLTNGEKVVVQKYLDLNGNGVIDSGEPMAHPIRFPD